MYSNESNILALNKNKFYIKLQTQLKKKPTSINPKILLHLWIP